MIIRPPFIICELALHGDGRLDYYLDIVEELREWWTGWPRIVIKTQLWLGRNTAWFKRVLAAHGRPPLPALSLVGLETLVSTCHDAEMGAACTAHDVQSMSCLSDYALDYLKLGSVGAADREMREAAGQMGLPLIMSTCLMGHDEEMALPEGIIRLGGVSAYPANCPWSGGTGAGYTCHSVPSLAIKHAVDAAERGARVIELHTSARDKSARPLPGDMCVSLSLAEFRLVCEAVGEVWVA